MDANGCMTEDTCVPNGDMCPHYCPYVPPTDCGQGMMNCPGWVDGMGCETGDTCVPYGEECPLVCPFVPPVDCGEGMMNCMGPSAACIRTPVFLWERSAPSTAHRCSRWTAERDR